MTSFIKMSHRHKTLTVYMRCHGCRREQAKFLSRHHMLWVPVCSQECSRRYCQLVFPEEDRPQSIGVKRGSSSDEADVSASEKPRKKATDCAWFKELEIDYNRVIGAGSNAVIFPARRKAAGKWPVWEDWNLVLRVAGQVRDRYVLDDDSSMRMVLAGPAVQNALGPHLGKDHLMVPLHWGACKAPQELRSRSPPLQHIPWWPPQPGDIHFMEVMKLMQGDVGQWQPAAARGFHLTKQMTEYYMPIKLTPEQATQLTNDTLELRLAVLIQMAAILSALHTLTFFHHKDLRLHNVLWRHRSFNDPQRRIFWWKHLGFALETSVPYIFLMSDYDLSDFGAEGPETPEIGYQHLCIELQGLAKWLELTEWLCAGDPPCRMIPVQATWEHDAHARRTMEVHTPRIDIFHQLRQKLPPVALGDPRLQQDITEGRALLITLPETPLPQFVEIAGLHTPPV